MIQEQYVRIIKIIILIITLTTQSHFKLLINELIEVWESNS